MKPLHSIDPYNVTEEEKLIILALRGICYRQWAHCRHKEHKKIYYKVGLTLTPLIDENRLRIFYQLRENTWGRSTHRSTQLRVWNVQELLQFAWFKGLTPLMFQSSMIEFIV